MLGQRCPRSRCHDARLRHDGDRSERQRLRYPRDPAFPREADAPGERGGEVVRMALERNAQREQPLRADVWAEGPACRRGARDEA